MSINDWHKFLGTLDLDAIYDLGNQWIAMGDSLYEKQQVLAGDVAAMAWTGQASVTAMESWAPPAGGTGVAQVLNDAAEQAWHTGEAINIYGDKIKEAAQKEAKQADAAMWMGIIGAIVAVAIPFLGAAVSAISAVARIIVSLVDVLATLEARIGNVAFTALAISSGATIGAALTLPFDLAVQSLGDLAGGAPFEIDWESEAYNIGLGAFLGGVFGGLATADPDLFTGGKGKGPSVTTNTPPAGGSEVSSLGGNKPGNNAANGPGTGPGVTPHGPPAGFTGQSGPKPGPGANGQKSSDGTSPNSTQHGDGPAQLNGQNSGPSRQPGKANETADENGLSDGGPENSSAPGNGFAPAGGGPHDLTSSRSPRPEGGDKGKAGEGQQKPPPGQETGQGKAGAFANTDSRPPSRGASGDRDANPEDSPLDSSSSSSSSRPPNSPPLSEKGGTPDGKGPQGTDEGRTSSGPATPPPDGKTATQGQGTLPDSAKGNQGGDKGAGETGQGQPGGWQA
jgi:hypothetical protein